MSILLYCVTDQGTSSDVGEGVAGLSVLHCKEAGLDALFSRNTSAESWTGASLKQSAREFHNVLQRAFASHAIVPFRFPTFMGGDEGELAAHLRDNAVEYSAQLKKFEHAVQMDISINSPGSVSSDAPQTSGAAFLRSRQERSEEFQAIARQIEEIANEAAQSWRDRPASNTLKLFALVNRASVAIFHERLKKFPVPRNWSVRVSGPWPVTEFLELKQR